MLESSGSFLLIVQIVLVVETFFVKIGFHVGNTAATIGVLTDNPLCNFIEGPVIHTQQQVIECEEEVTGKYFIIQGRGAGDHYVGFNEIAIHGTFL